MDVNSINADVAASLDVFFTAAYCSEMTLKILALGLIMNEDSYLRNNWNVLDCVIVITGLISTFSDSQNFNGLRSLRVVRPLRTISKIKSLKYMVRSLFQSLKMLKDSLVIMFFYYTIFTIMSL